MCQIYKNWGCCLCCASSNYYNMVKFRGKRGCICCCGVCGGHVFYEVSDGQRKFNMPLEYTDLCCGIGFQRYKQVSDHKVRVDHIDPDIESEDFDLRIKAAANIYQQVLSQLVPQFSCVTPCGKCNIQSCHIYTPCECYQYGQDLNQTSPNFTHYFEKPPHYAYGQ